MTEETGIETGEEMTEGMKGEMIGETTGGIGIEIGRGIRTGEIGIQKGGIEIQKGGIGTVRGAGTALGAVITNQDLKMNRGLRGKQANNKFMIIAITLYTCQVCMLSLLAA